MRCSLRAQLARLLRQVGQDVEAKSEAALCSKRLLPTRCRRARRSRMSPAAVEIKAAALEGSGDDAKAAEAYARRVELAARAFAGEFGESQIPGMRDWWIGRAYAACALRSGRPAAVESTLRAQIALPAKVADRSGERAARMLLAFLLEEQGKPSLAMSEWRSLITKSAPEAASNPAPEPPASAKTGI